MSKFLLVEYEDDGKTVVEEIELSKFEYGQAKVMHQRMAQRKAR